MNAFINGYTDFQFPMTPEDITRELRKPESPLRKMLNAADNEAALRQSFIEMVFFNEARDRQQREALLSDLIAEARIANKEKFPDIVATPLFNVSGAEYQKKIQNEPVVTQKEILQDQLNTLDDRIKALKATEKTVTNAYHDARKLLINTMAEKAEQTPVFTPDGQKTDVRKALEKIPSAEKPFQQYLDSVLKTTEIPTKETGEFFMIEALTIPIEHSRKEEVFTNSVVKKVTAMEEMQIQFDAIRQYIDASSNGHVNVETGPSAKMILDSLKKNNHAVSNIMSADRKPHDDALHTVISTVTERKVTEHARDQVQLTLHSLDENKNHYTTPRLGGR